MDRRIDGRTRPMKIEQIAVYVENKPGRLSAIIHSLAGAGIDIRALSISDSPEFGVLRMIVNDPDGAYRILREGDFTVSKTKVLGVRMPDAPGGLSAVLTVLNENGINLEYMYTFSGAMDGDASIVFKVENIEEAISRLEGTGIHLMTTEEAYRG